MPILSDLTTVLLVIVLFFFLLYAREDLRDRVVRLMARVRVTLAAEAIATASSIVSQYLLLFCLINLGYGLSIATVMWALGLPNPVFWGALAFLLRFIPYVGALISAVLPTLVAFAVFPGWSKSLEVFGSFVVLDQIAAQFVEPFFIGHGIGLSPLALLVSAMSSSSGATSASRPTRCSLTRQRRSCRVTCGCPSMSARARTARS